MLTYAEAYFERADEPRHEDATPKLAFSVIGRVGTCTRLVSSDRG
jgi:hypothetical protein